MGRLAWSLLSGSAAVAQVEWHNQLQSETDSRHSKPEFFFAGGLF